MPSDSQCPRPRNLVMVEASARMSIQSDQKQSCKSPRKYYGKGQFQIYNSPSCKHLALISGELERTLRVLSQNSVTGLS